MKKTTKKAPAKTVAKKASSVRSTATKKAAPKKAVQEKEVLKKTAVAKKIATEQIEPVKEVAKKPVRKSEPAVKRESEKAEVKEVKVEAVKPTAVKPEAVKKVQEVKPEPKVVPVEPVAIHEEVKPKEVKPRTIVRRQEMLAHGVGRRKTAVARVWLKLGSGKLVVNGDAYDQYFCTESARLSATTPFRIIAKAQHYDVAANVNGGGVCAQADAVRLGFVRALVQLNEEWRPQFRKAGLLTVDSRQKERKKYGQKGARRKFQFVKR